MLQTRTDRKIVVCLDHQAWSSGCTNDGPGQQQKWQTSAPYSNCMQAYSCAEMCNVVGCGCKLLRLERSQKAVKRCDDASHGCDVSMRLTWRPAKVLHCLPSVLGSSEQYSVSTSGCQQCQLVKGQAFTTSLPHKAQMLNHQVETQQWYKHAMQHYNSATGLLCCINRQTECAKSSTPLTPDYSTHEVLPKNGHYSQ